jgi:hypothetical protein
VIESAELSRFGQFLSSEYPVLNTFIKHHRTHKDVPASLVGYPYLIEFLKDKSRDIRVIKSTQCGATEVLVVNAIEDCRKGRNVFHVLPTYLLKNQFVSERFDKSVAFTPYYKQLVKGDNRFTDNASLKTIGKGAIAFVGSNTTSAFTSFPADTLIIDERDECDQNNLVMAEERLSASKSPRTIEIGNPTFDDFGIDYEFKKSNRKLWHIKCDSCNSWFVPDFFKHVVQEVEDNNYVVLDKEFDNTNPSKEIRLICTCGAAVNRYKSGKWVKTATSPSEISGYHISKLFSTNVRLRSMVDKFNEGLTNDTKLQRFYNGDLGLPYTAKGAKIDFSMLNSCKRDYTIQVGSEKGCVSGTDVGSLLHTTIGELTPDGDIRTLSISAPTNFDDLLALYKRFNIKLGCIDAMPDLHYAKKVRDSHRGIFPVFVSKVKVDKVDTDKRTISVHRTAFLDALKESFMLENVWLPKNADKLDPTESDGISEFYHQVCNSVRVYSEDKDEYNWIEGSKPDHYMFALGFMVLARKLLRSA